MIIEWTSGAFQQLQRYFTTAHVCTFSGFEAVDIPTYFNATIASVVSYMQQSLDAQSQISIEATAESQIGIDITVL